MAVAVRLREDYSADDLRGLASKARHGAQTRRLVALAAIADGQSRDEAAAIGLMDRQTLRDWVIRFNAEGPVGLIDRSSPGRPPKLTPAQKQEVRQCVNRHGIRALLYSAGQGQALQTGFPAWRDALAGPRFSSR